MTEDEAKKLASQHINTTRSPHLAQALEHGDKKIWNVSFAGDGEEPIIVSIDDSTSEVLKVFEPMKMMAAAPEEVRGIITSDPDKR